MKKIRGLQKLPAFRRPTCLTVGTFDGVHRGHQKVIGQVIDRAASLGLTSVVVTFDPHPRSSLGEGYGPPLLTCTPHKLALLEQLGVDVCILLELDDQLASMPAREFVTTVLHEKLKAAGVVLGPRSRFGKGRTGNPRLLKEWGRKLGFWVDVVDEVFVDGVAISSTMVRQLVLEGDLSAAELFLGRPFSILGRVVRGRTVGRTLGFRTANVRPCDQVIPPRGVYAVKVVIDGEERPGALNVGVRPTFSEEDASSPVVEVHIIDFDRPIYRKRIEVVFHRRIREERRFESPRGLSAQIALDIEEIKRYFCVGISSNPSRIVKQRKSIPAPGDGNC